MGEIVVPELPYKQIVRKNSYVFLYSKRGGRDIELPGFYLHDDIPCLIVNEYYLIPIKAIKTDKLEDIEIVVAIDTQSGSIETRIVKEITLNSRWLGAIEGYMASLNAFYLSDRAQDN